MKISIITVTYNSSNTLSQTLDSILRQTHPDIECIVIDGQSTDNTLSIIKEYEKYFNGRFKWISEKDYGLYDAMNKGINMATGDVVGILNSDDFFTNVDVIEKIASAFSNLNIEAVYGDVHFVKSSNLKKIVRYYSSAIFTRKLMRFGLMPAHPSFYAKKEVFNRFGFYRIDYKIAADFEFLLRVIYKGMIKTHYLPIDMVTMRTGGVSTSGFSSHRLIMKEHLRAFRENKISTNVLLLSCRYFYKLYEVIKSKL